MSNATKHITALTRIRDTKMRVAKVANSPRALEEMMAEIDALNFCISMIEAVLYEDENTIKKEK